MADLTYIEKANIENFLRMKSGYVMDFSDRTFQEFVGEAVGLDINDPKYHYSSNSKANRLRQFIKVESNYTFGKLLSAFCDYWLSKVHTGEIDYHNDENLYKECVKIADRLKQESIVEHIDAIKPNAEDRDFKLLAKSIRESIERNEPEVALDRLHTFTFKYLRELCDKHNIAYDKTDSLNAVFGKYVKFIDEDGSTKAEFYLTVNTKNAEGDRDETSMALTFGHEAFIHLDQYNDRAVDAANRNDKSALGKLATERMGIASDRQGGKEHDAYLRGDSQYQRMNTYTSQLKAIYNPASVDKAKKSHDQVVKKNTQR